MKKFLIITFLFIVSTSKVFADSSYALPYPSFLPGSKFYLPSKIYEKVDYFWHFGNLNKFEYFLNLSDKYLVEGKTLIDYGQYKLAYSSLISSSENFHKTTPYLEKAKKEGKNISHKKKLQEEASLKHIETLNKLRKETPEEVVWSPEKEIPSKLELHKLIEESIRERQVIL